MSANASACNGTDSAITVDVDGVDMDEDEFEAEDIEEEV
jgi:hypothetical protein